MMVSLIKSVNFWNLHQRLAMKSKNIWVASCFLTRVLLYPGFLGQRGLNISRIRNYRDPLRIERDSQFLGIAMWEEGKLRQTSQLREHSTASICTFITGQRTCWCLPSVVTPLISAGYFSSLPWFLSLSAFDSGHCSTPLPTD
jgi:hypothetical protein